MALFLIYKRGFLGLEKEWGIVGWETREREGILRVSFVVFRWTWLVDFLSYFV